MKNFLKWILAAIIVVVGFIPVMIVLGLILLIGNVCKLEPQYTWFMQRLESAFGFGPGWE